MDPERGKLAIVNGYLCSRVENTIHGKETSAQREGEARDRDGYQIPACSFGDMSS